MAAAAAASWPVQMSPTAKRESSEDINAPPESDSSDEEVSTPVKPIAPPQLDQVFKDIGQDVLTGKVAATKEFKGGTRSTRSRQSRLKDEGPQLPSPPQVKNEPSQEDEVMDSWVS
jgi:hypothetical protein